MLSLVLLNIIVTMLKGVAPLFELTKQDVEFMWTPIYQSAFHL